MEYLSPNRVVAKPTLKMDPLGRRLADERVANFWRGQKDGLMPSDQMPTYSEPRPKRREPVSMPRYTVSK